MIWRPPECKICMVDGCPVVIVRLVGSIRFRRPTIVWPGAICPDADNCGIVIVEPPTPDALPPPMLTLLCLILLLPMDNIEFLLLMLLLANKLLLTGIIFVPSVFIAGLVPTLTPVLYVLMLFDTVASRIRINILNWPSGHFGGGSGVESISSISLCGTCFLFE